MYDIQVSLHVSIVCGTSDGHPLSVGGVDQLDQNLYSVPLKWDEAPVPADSPILGYIITIIPENQEMSVSCLYSESSHQDILII